MSDLSTTDPENGLPTDPNQQQINPSSSTAANTGNATSTTSPPVTPPATSTPAATTVTNADGSTTTTNADGTTTTTPAPVPAALQQNANNINNPTLPTGGTATATMQTANPNELGDPTANDMAVTPPVQAATVDNTATANAAPTTQANTYNAAQIDPNAAPTVNTATGTINQNDLVTAAQQTSLSPALQQTIDAQNAAIAAVGVDPNSTVQGQYAQLTDFSAGTPGWAKNALNMAESTMASRGLGNSSVAGGAITTAILQAALPIATQDAQVFQTMQLTKMSQTQAMAVLQAGYIANMDTQNLNNRQQANVINAQNFLSMDMSNLTNEQQSAIVDTQSRLQTMLSDQSAVNAAQQFNATSQNQTDQFYASQANTISQFNAAQQNGMAQFNAGQTNSVNEFNNSQQQAVDQFNAQNQTLIDQSNLTYLRQINTTNTAATNSANLVNSQNLVNISNTAMANQIQLIRDQASYSFQAGQNDEDRAQQAALLNLQNTQWFQKYNATQSSAFSTAVGSFLFKVATPGVTSAVTNALTPSPPPSGDTSGSSSSGDTSISGSSPGDAASTNDGTNT